MIYSRKIAEFYDLFYEDKPYRDEAEYAARLIKARRPGATTILDLGCGTGLRTLEFARLGYKVLGVDQSPSMLAAARQNLIDRPDVSPNAVEFESGDITTFRGKSRFDVIISLFHVFSYLTTGETLAHAVEGAFTNLNPGGVLLFDYWHGPGVLRDPPAVRTKVVEKEDLRAERTAIPQHLAERHLVEVNVSLRVTHKNDGASEQSEESYTMRYWFPEELEEVLQKCGFDDVRHYSWMTESAPGPDSWQACTIALKP